MVLADIIGFMQALDFNRQELDALCQQYGVAELEVFGSVARGEAGSTSDLDILYTMLPGRAFGWDIDDFQEALERIFGRRVDLVSRKYLHPLLREEVFRDAEEIYHAAA